MSVYFIEIMLEKSESYFIKKSKHPLKDVCFLLPLACLQKTFLYTSGIRINVYVYPYLPVG